MDAKKIIMVVEDYFNLQEGISYVLSHKEEIVKSRSIAMYFMKEVGYSIPEICETFNFQSSNVNKAIKRVKDQIEVNRIYRQQIDELKKIIMVAGFNNSQEVKLITHVWLKRKEENIFKPLESIEE